MFHYSRKPFNHQRESPGLGVTGRFSAVSVGEGRVEEGEGRGGRRRASRQPVLLPAAFCDLCSNWSGAAALLSGRFVPLALIVLAPVMVNIVAIHPIVPSTSFWDLPVTADRRSA